MTTPWDDQPSPAQERLDWHREAATRDDARLAEGPDDDSETTDGANEVSPDEINFTLLADLSTKPHPLLNRSPECRFMCVTHNEDHWVGEVVQEARNSHHLLDLIEIPQGRGYSSDLDARMYRAIRELIGLRERLARISGWHSRETGPAGMVGDFCVDCGSRWPCDTRRMADGSYVDDQAEDTR